MKLAAAFIAALALTSSSAALAGECVLKIKRVACPGKEAEAFKPYMGKTETSETKEAASAEECTQIADKKSKIDRTHILSLKEVQATFGGKDLGKTFSDKSDCKEKK